MKLAGLCSFALISLFAACGGSDSDQTPPPTTGYTDIEQFLSKASYKTWVCEPKIHASRPPSPHGFNRICSNDLIAATSATDTSPWPKGAAAVKELYASLTATTPIGYAVYLKTDANSASGANWYWYERIPADSATPPPHDANGVVADGKGGSGPPMTICVGCHAGAGMDAAHTPSPGARDQVYTPVH